MKAYERLSVEVVKFEAQDVITASVAAPVKPETNDECICRGTDNNRCNSPGEEAGEHRVYYADGGYKDCPATTHKCVKVS